MWRRHTDQREEQGAPPGVHGDAWRKIIDAVRVNVQRPTRIAVMGQTGVGKSSLINALFNADLRTGAVRPTTTEAAEVRTELGEGRSLIFVDLPGIGESRTADAHYLDMYKEELTAADIVLWLFSAESRSLLTDVNGLATLLSDPVGQAPLQKISFAITKADLVAAPWILSHDGATARCPWR